jgi:hypothetical protein
MSDHDRPERKALRTTGARPACRQPGCADVLFELPRRDGRRSVAESAERGLGASGFAPDAGGVANTLSCTHEPRLDLSPRSLEWHDGRGAVASQAVDWTDLDLRLRLDDLGACFTKQPRELRVVDAEAASVGRHHGWDPRVPTIRCPQFHHAEIT